MDFKYCAPKEKNQIPGGILIYARQPLQLQGENYSDENCQVSSAPTGPINLYLLLLRGHELGRIFLLDYS